VARLGPLQNGFDGRGWFPAPAPGLTRSPKSTMIYHHQMDFATRQSLNAAHHVVSAIIIYNVSSVINRAVTRSLFTEDAFDM